MPNNRELGHLSQFRNAGKLIEIEAEGEADAVFRDTVDALRDFLLADAWTCFVIGAPKSGRTTQSRKLEAALKTARVGWEELAKAEMDKGTKLGKSLEKKKRKGIAVTKTTILTMIKVGWGGGGGRRGGGGGGGGGGRGRGRGGR